MINIGNTKNPARFAETKTALPALPLPNAAKGQVAMLSEDPAEMSTDQDAVPSEEPAAVLELTYGALKEKHDAIYAENQQAQDVTSAKSSNIVDETYKLTRRLVAALTQQMVRDVLSDAYKHMLDLHLAAAAGDKKAAAAAKRLDKLISRANRKIRDLNKEDNMLQKKKNAEKAKQEQIARRLLAELKRAIKERKQREKKYLHDAKTHDDNAPALSGPSIASLEAKIMALAHSLAQLSASSADAGGIGFGDGVTVSDSGGAIATGEENSVEVLV